MSATCRAALKWLFGLQSRGVKLGLDNVRALLGGLGHPEAGLRCVHVAGTNGKGSVCAMAAAVTRAAGVRTGLFTSPHLVRFNERIEVDGVPISDDEIVDGLSTIRSQVEVHPATFFEITTALAFWHFQRRQVDLAVLETGLGGRLDATNVVQRPLGSVITAIDLDHQSILGQTRVEIAREKAGIIKPGVPVVSGPQVAEVAAVLRQIAGEQHASLSFVSKPVAGYEVGLFGSHQRLNAAIALAGLSAAGFDLPETAVRRGLRDVSWPGRFQMVRPGLVIDGAHNPAASRRLAATWQEYRPQERPLVIFGGLRDKALSEMVAALGDIAAEFFLVPVNNARAADPGQLASSLPPGIPHRAFGSVADALRAAEGRRNEVLVTGSLFLVGEVLAILEGPGGRQERSEQ
ncbi:MAG: bifunctional folylpolyglutamate synthase/dihydrofolate synthase [Verrucomicrobia bacterium]|nr:bifunctional folylpolyglutamate synthase/dihydrofolate synthase [Verrucomicrobiota bacterium]